MLTNEQLIKHLEDNTQVLNEIWSHIFPAATANLATNLTDLPVFLNHCFGQPEAHFQAQAKAWAVELAGRIPLHHCIASLYQLQAGYQKLLASFFGTTATDRADWETLLANRFRDLIIFLTEQHEQLYQSQQDEISVLSAPVIKLTEVTAVLPLMGYQATSKPTDFVDNVLDSCLAKSVQVLLIDLSAVTFVNTNLAQKLFTLVDSLHLLGIETTLSGVRPEIAQAAIQLGINCDRLEIASTLANAIHDRYQRTGQL